MSPTDNKILYTVLYTVPPILTKNREPTSHEEPDSGILTKNPL